MTVLHDRDPGRWTRPWSPASRTARGSGARLAGGARVAAEISGTSLVGREVRLLAAEGGTAYDLG